VETAAWLGATAAAIGGVSIYVATRDPEPPAVVATAPAPVPGPTPDLVPVPPPAPAPDPVPVPDPDPDPDPVPVSVSDSGPVPAPGPGPAPAPAPDSPRPIPRPAAAADAAPPADAAAAPDTEDVLVERAKIALARSRFDEALALLKEHEKRFARGPLRSQRELLFIRALLGRSDRATALERADRLRHDFPDDPSLPAIDALLAK
jgi:hypothetical protein